MREDKEHKEQSVFIEWCHLQSRKYPELHLMFAVPNGGHRSATTAGKLKKEGVKAGIPDLHLPVARGKYHSLFIEMKVKGNRPTPKQTAMMELLASQGNLCIVCYGAKEAIDTTLAYLHMEPE